MSRTEAVEKVSTTQLKGMMRGIVYHEEHVRAERTLVPLLNDKRW